MPNVNFGKLEKMLILAFSDSKKAEGGGRADADEAFEALINPESYTQEFKLKFSKEQGHGASGHQLKYQYTEPEEMSFDFLFDGTGIIDGSPHKSADGKETDSIVDDIKKFRSVLVDYKGDSHEPRHFKLVWGEFIFKGRVTEISINYKLFNRDGRPIRAVAKVKFKSSIEDLKRAAKDDKNSPDLTHVRTVKQGDTLPLMCYAIYGDPRHYLSVAKVNGLGNFRNLVPGTRISFPPIDKTARAA